MTVPSPPQRFTLALAALCGVFTAADQLAAQPPAVPGVTVSELVERSIASTQVFVGTVEPVRRATIGAAVDGRIVEFPIDQGDRVEAGQKLAQLLTDTISLELAAAQAELRLREERLGELRNGSRPEEIEQARARLAAAEARTRFARARSKRTEAAFESGRAVSEDEHEEMIAVAAEAQEAMLEARAVHELAVAGPRAEVIAQAEAEVAVQRAVAERLSDQVQKHTVIARFAGYVVAEYTEEGAWVNRGGPVAEVVALDEVEVIAQVVEGDVPFIVPGQEVEVEVTALPGEKFRGRVVVTVPQADSRSRTFPVKVRVANKITEAGPTLKPGMLARVTLPVGNRQTATLAPKDAVVLGGRAPMLFVVDGSGEVGAEGKARAVPVELGVASGPLIQVSGDIRPGDHVVVEGNERLRPDQPVRIGRVIPTSTESL